MSNRAVIDGESCEAGESIVLFGALYYVLTPVQGHREERLPGHGPHHRSRFISTSFQIYGAVRSERSRTAIGPHRHGNFLGQLAFHVPHKGLVPAVDIRQPNLTLGAERWNLELEDSLAEDAPFRAVAIMSIPAGVTTVVQEGHVPLAALLNRTPHASSIRCTIRLPLGNHCHVKGR